MTLDVTIGRKYLASVTDEDISEMNIKNWTGPTEWWDVKRCPKASEDICNPLYTCWPRESYRSGSTDFHMFFDRVFGWMQIHRLLQQAEGGSIVIDLFNIYATIKRTELPRDLEGKDMEDRLTWMKYWTLEAVSLYGNNAAIQFLTEDRESTI